MPPDPNLLKAVPIMRGGKGRPLSPGARAELIPPLVAAYNGLHSIPKLAARVGRSEKLISNLLAAAAREGLVTLRRHGDDFTSCHRFSTEERAEMRVRLAEDYTRDPSIRRVAERWGLSSGLARTLLREAQDAGLVTLHRPGGHRPRLDNRTRITTTTSGVPSDPE
ncbi:helix-turn-helix domain-containing protein [Streptomyces sp. NPDC001633]|uniref:helix-turn-helix domain-containing protein n=1 Tax=Streptomyces sp. NPDC001633 TaxID=3364595 RepID=UPI0036C9B9B5